MKIFCFVKDDETGKIIEITLWKIKRSKKKELIRTMAECGLHGQEGWVTFFNSAITLMNHSIEEEKQGRIIVSLKEESGGFTEDYEPVTLPILENLRSAAREN